MPCQLISDFLTESVPAPPGETDARLLIAEADHRIANNLSLIAGILRLQANEIVKMDRPMSPSDVGELLSEVRSRIETVGRLHRLLAEADGGGGSLNLNDYLHGVATAAIHSMSGRDVVLSRPSSLNRHIPAKIALSVGLVVSEAVTNAVKYAHPAGVRGRISLGCERGPDESILIQVVDDGVGLPEGFDPSADGGLGLRMMRIIAGQLGARLTFDSGDVGLTVDLRLPPIRSMPIPTAMA